MHPSRSATQARPTVRTRPAAPARPVHPAASTDATGWPGLAGPVGLLVLTVLARVHARVLIEGARHRRRLVADAGQTTAEYALVLLGAAALALLFITWATKTDRVGKLLDFVFEQITGRAR